VCRCECGWPVHSQIAIVLQCPKCLSEIRCGGEPRGVAAATRSLVPLTGSIESLRSLWVELHHFPFSDSWSCQTRCQWWKNWQARVPNLGCDCRRHWRDLVERMPPDFSSPAAFFAWSVSAHNAVNTRLGKPVVPLEEARCLYDPTTAAGRTGSEGRQATLRPAT
jgi:hypothetical protein